MYVTISFISLYIYIYTHMNYSDSSFVSIWEDGILQLQCFKLKHDTFSLISIILDAACKQGHFSLAWDLRDMNQPSFKDLFNIASFASKWKWKLDEKIERTSILATPRASTYLNYILKTVPPRCPYYLGCSFHEWQSFLT
jgi:hypothetical protein